MENILKYLRCPERGPEANKGRYEIIYPNLTLSLCSVHNEFEKLISDFRS